MRRFSRLNGSWLTAGVIAVGIGVYLITADVVNINDRDKPPAPLEQGDVQSILPSVKVSHFEQTSIARTLTLYGRTETDRTVTVSGELAARVVAVSARRGQLMKAGEEIVRLREGSLKAQLASADAKVRQARQDYQSALSLQQKKHIAENQLVQLEAALAEALSQKDQLQIQWENTRIKAPVAGILNKRHVEVGDFIDKGKPVAEILDLDPLVIHVDIPQINISHFQPGQQASVRFMDGRTAQARIRYIDR
ncbi:MAG: efflux RND transporter periplasmic adaptor subunit, partial [Endozoicomonas sp.]